MHYLYLAFMGLIIGAIARFVLPGEQKMGWIMTSLLGIAGSVIAGVAGQAVGWYKPGETSGWIASVIVAVVLLVVVQKLRAGGGGGASGSSST
jgi:uncharacterized membrane protein YeaQ/YmgE (transglycosylase-associated protein family)